MEKCQHEYIKEETDKLANKQAYENAAEKAADLLFKVAYEKYVIDRNLKKTSKFEKPNIDVIYKMIANDPAYCNKIQQRLYSEYKCEGYSGIIDRKDLQKRLEQKYELHLEPMEKIGLFIVLAIFCTLFAGVIYLIYKFFCLIFG